MLSDAITFFSIVLVLTITPGADMALVMRNVLVHGRGSILPTLAGIETGLLVHVTLCVAGLSVVLQRSELAFSTVKLVGAAWLVWLGVGALRTALAERRRAKRAGHGAEGVDPRTAEEAIGAPATRARSLYLRGFLTNVLNVKIALFYIAFLPQFAPSGPSFVPVAIGLAAVQAAIGLTWLAAYGLLVARVGNALQDNPRVRQLLETVTGVALVGFGLRLALARR